MQRLEDLVDMVSKKKLVETENAPSIISLECRWKKIKKIKAMLLIICMLQRTHLTVQNVRWKGQKLTKKHATLNSCLLFEILVINVAPKTLCKASQGS